MSGLLVVIPCLNEAAHLAKLLEQLGADPAAQDARLVVVDGGSSDESAEIVRRQAAIDPRIMLLANPKKVQSAALNLAVDAHGGDASAIVRVDAHARYPAHYLSLLTRAQETSNADAVAVSMRAVDNGGGCFQRAAACAQNSVLGAGGSPHRKGGARRWVDHGHHALITVAAFRAANGYDESFSHNEDAEFDARLADAGGRILLAGDILIDYFPRATARALARQYYMYGRGRARTALKHKRPLKPRQLAPIFVAPAIALAALAPIAPLAGAPAGVWMLICLGYGAVLGLRAGQACAAASGVPAMIMHAAWSLGFLRELIAPTRAAPALLRAKQA